MIAFDKIACIEKWTVFINKGAGNFPISSPKRVLLYLIKPTKDINEKGTIQNL